MAKVILWLVCSLFFNPEADNIAVKIGRYNGHHHKKYPWATHHTGFHSKMYFHVYK